MSLEKEFVSYVKVRNSALKMAMRIYEDGFEPDILYVLMRGGAYLGNVFSEVFQMLRTAPSPLLCAAVVAHSYTVKGEQRAVKIEGWTYDPQYIRPNEKVLLVDDIYDSGHTVDKLASEITSKGVLRENLRIVVFDYKKRPNPQGSPIFFPDYYCRLHDIVGGAPDTWIHYKSHEIAALKDSEIQEQYLDEDPSLDEFFQKLKKYKRRG